MKRPDYAIDQVVNHHRIVSRFALKDGRMRWRCRCERCGHEADIRRGKIATIGCPECDGARRDPRIKRPRHYVGRRGVALHPVWAIWASMLRRCRKPQSDKERLYSGRKVCERWHVFENFVADMGPRPSPKHSIDRINNDGDYEPGNVRWATSKQQRRNRPDNLVLELDGITQTAGDWAEQLGFHRGVIPSRIKRGWTVRAALTTPVRKRAA